MKSRLDKIINRNVQVQESTNQNRIGSSKLDTNSRITSAKKNVNSYPKSRGLVSK